ncbi:MAG: hypothetical protein DME19_14435 [Verrucomicrobia bacterium]|nr:MAG: hypothetical protein DME19_14435 [Verrucomicrobiota bacterium]
MAKQHVVIDSEEIHATGEEATYRLASDAVELTGKPAWRLRQYEGRAQSLAVNRMAHEFHAIGDVEMKLPAGSIGRNGFLLPESSPATNAAPATAQPALVRADDFQFRPDVANTNFNVAVFRDHVQATSAKGSLSCELMTIQSTAQSNRTESVVAERGVVMAQGERRVTGEKAVYTAAADTVEVTGHPAWKMGQHQGTAEVLAFNLKGDSYRATRRVEMRLPPASFGRTPWLLAKSGVLTNSSTGAGGATTPRPAQPIEISCDEFELTPDAANTNLNLAIYRGQVRVRDVDRMKLSCEFLAVRGRMLPGTNQVEKVVAEGNVDLEVHESRGERRAQGDKAIYTAADGEVELSGNGGVKIAFVDSKIEGSAMGAKAVYAGGQDVLELTGNSVLGNPVLRTQDGQVWGEVLVLDHANTTLRATGRWKMKLKPESLKKTAAPAAPKPGS